MIPGPYCQRTVSGNSQKGSYSGWYNLKYSILLFTKEYMKIKGNYQRLQNINNSSNRRGWVWEKGTFKKNDLYEWKGIYISRVLNVFSLSLSNSFWGNSIKKIFEFNRRVIFRIHIATLIIMPKFGNVQQEKNCYDTFHKMIT